jgi:hypothetical protein
MHIFPGKNKDEDADRQKKQPPAREKGAGQLNQLSPEKEALRQKQAEIDERMRLYRQRKQAVRRQQEETRRHMRSSFNKLRLK